MRRSKISLKKMLLLATLAGAALSPALILCFVPVIPTWGSSAAPVLNSVIPSNAEQIIPGLPARIKITKIRVDAAIESVGLAPDGSIGIPKGPTNTAWFNLGPRPGEIGDAVIVGHYGVWKGGLPTVFNNLYKLRKGDKVHVKDKKGATVTFVVKKLQTYGENEAAPDVFNSNDGKAHLNLVTCQGIWNKNRKSYSERLVVFTDKE